MSQEPTQAVKSQMEAEAMGGNCGASEPFALQVTDDSMEPEFKRSCIIIIDPTGLVQDGKYVLAKDESGFIFRQVKIEGGRYYLQPLNQNYNHEKREVPFDDIQGVIVQQASSKGKRSERKRYE